MKEDDCVLERLRALALIDNAIALCDGLGESAAACHLQLGADRLRESGERASTGDRRGEAAQ